MPKLTNKQEAFAQHYAIHGNASEAYKAAGFSTKGKSTTISVQAHKVMNKPHVALRIEELTARKLAKLDQKFDISIERIAQEFAAIAFAKPSDYYRWGMRTVVKRRGRGEHVTEYEVEEPYVEVVPSDQLTETQMKAISSAEMSVSRSGDVVISVPMADRIAALRELGKHVGFYEKDNSQRASNFYIVEDDAV